MGVMEKLKAIADSLRSCGSDERGCLDGQILTDKLHLADMPAVVQRCRGVGYAEGEMDGRAAGVTEGKQAEYDRFWDAYQDNGKRTDYNIYAGSFSGKYWTDELFNPKYLIAPTSAAQMFRSTGITDLEKHAAKLDFSKATDLGYAFAYGGVLKKLPVIDVSNAVVMTSTFAEYEGESLSLIASEKSGFSSNTFNYCSNLINLTISGTIAKSVSLQHSTKLTKESIESIWDALSTTATGQTLTLSQTAVNNAFWDNEAGGPGAAWDSMCSEKSNWTITLV